MTYRLPAPDSPLRELFDVDTLMQMHESRSWPTFRQVIMSAPEGEHSASVCVRATGDVWLVSVGPRGGWKRLWTFGRV